MKKQCYNDTKTGKKNSTKIENTKTISLLNIDEKIPNKITENMIQKKMIRGFNTEKQGWFKTWKPINEIYHRNTLLEEEAK